MPNKVLLIGRASKNIGGKATGGIAKHIEDLSLNLSKRGIRPFIWDFTLQKTLDKKSVTIFGVSYLNKALGLLYSFFSENIWLSKTYKNLSLRDKFIVGIQSYQIKKIVQKHDFRTIHAHSLNRPIINLLRKSFPNINLVVTDHGFWQKTDGAKRTKKKRILGKILENIEASNVVIVISDFSIDKFKEYSLPLFKTQKISNPIYISNIPIDAKAKKENIILFNGYNKSIDIKNLPVLIQAISKSELLRKDFKLIAIVNNKAKELVEKQKTPFEMELLGSQTWEKLVDLYNKSKILVVPSKSESFGLVYMEALAVGTPVIGFHKTIDEFQNVLQIEIGDTFDNDRETAEDLSFKIENVVSKTYDRELMRKRVKEKYDWENKIEFFIKIYFEEGMYAK
ncbi:glycosyltransferase family 4 protein [Allomuricauda sp.]|uniref:glycosyltransferase family 4 protein n=1 Tax=Flagellimonas alginolytica TaxID=3177515 RepID=UPI0025CEFB7B|nr:glycosyltransferase family 4 protein [Allomuricauda sp.]